MNSYAFGDCMNWLSLMPDNRFGLALLDPPWGIGEDGRRKRATRGVKQTNGQRLRVSAPVSEEIWDDEPMPQEFFDQIFRVSQHQIIFGTNNFEFDQQNTSSGRIIWDKVNGQTDQADCEIAWTSLFRTVRQVEYMWNGMMQGKSLKEGRVAQGNKKLNEKRLQHGQKPVLLYRWLLNLKEVKKDWRILDPTVGSGSSLIACEMEGFSYTGFEKNWNHYERSKKRLQDFKKQLSANFTKDAKNTTYQK